MSTELEPSALTSSSPGDLEEPLASRLVESALDEAFTQMASAPQENGTAQNDAEEEEEEEDGANLLTDLDSPTHAATPLAHKLVAEAMEEAVERMGRSEGEKEEEVDRYGDQGRSSLRKDEEEEEEAREKEVEEIKEETKKEEIIEKEEEKKEEIVEKKEEKKEEVTEKEEEEKEEVTEKKEEEKEEVTEKKEEVAEKKEEEKEEVTEKEEEEEEEVTEKEEEEVTEKKEEVTEKEEEEKEASDGYMDILGNGLLRKKTIIAGKGRDTRPLHGDSVTVSYVSYLNDDMTEIERDETTFVVGDGDVVQALDLAVGLSELQEHFELISDARFAYGKKGLPPRIPPNATLRFVVQLERCDEPPAYAAMTSVQQLACANQKRERGNFLYEREEFALSINSYNKALDILNSSRNHSPANSSEASPATTPVTDTRKEEEEVRETKIKIYNNMAAAQIRIEAFDAAVQSCDEVLRLSPENVKALFRRGKAKVGAGELPEAVRNLRAALRHEPDSRIVQTELNRVLALVKRERESQQKLYRRMFGSQPGQEGAGPTDDRSPGAAQTWRRYLYYGAGVALVGVSVALASAAIKYHQLHQ